MATANPWYGYRRIAVMCRRDGKRVNNRMCYRVMKLHGLLQKPRPRAAELHQAAKLYELLPSRPNALWQMDVTYIHIPTSGWWYAVTVIDYYSRYLLALHLTPSYCATEVIMALKLARGGRTAPRPHEGTAFPRDRHRHTVGVVLVLPHEVGECRLLPRERLLRRGDAKPPVGNMTAGRAFHA